MAVWFSSSAATTKTVIFLKFLVDHKYKRVRVFVFPLTSCLGKCNSIGDN